MGEWFLYCAKCHKKGKILTDKQAVQYFEPDQRRPECCGQLTVLKATEGWLPDAVFEVKR